jgi:signal transduction histidine kinase
MPSDLSNDVKRTTHLGRRAAVVMTGCVCWMLCVGLVSALAAEKPFSDGKSATITNAIQVRRLSVEESLRAIPVHLSGVVTYSDSDWNMLFVQDASTGIYLNQSDARQRLSAGQSVEIDGFTDPGNFTPVVSEARVLVKGDGVLPKPAVTSIRALSDGAADGNWVEIRGTVGSVSVEAGHLTMLHVQEGNCWIKVLVQTAPEASLQNLVNARVSIRGVCAVSANERRQVATVKLFVPGSEFVRVEEPPSHDRFAMPVRNIRDVSGSGAAGNGTNLMRVQGVVQKSSGGRSFVIADRTGRIDIETSQTNDLKPGLLIDAIGSPDRRRGRPILNEVKFRRIGAGQPDPLALTNSTPATRLLTTVRQVRALKPDEAAVAWPVRIRCVVTCYYRDWATLFVQDATAGIYVNLDGHTLDLELGQWIELEGVTAPGDFAPIIAQPRFRDLGRAPLPPAAMYPLKAVDSGIMDSQWLQMSGTVHSVELQDGHLTLNVVDDGAEFEVLIGHPPSQPVPDFLVDAKVRLNGVCATIFNQKRQLVGVRLFVPNLDFVTPEQSPPMDPFSRPVHAIGSLLQFASAEEAQHRLRVQGTVTLNRPKEFFYIQDETGGLLVKTVEEAAVKVGDRLDVVGFAQTGNYTPVMTRANFRKLPAGNPPAAVSVTAERALSADFDKDIFDAKLVRIEGRLLDLTVISSEKILTLQQGGMVFKASLSVDATGRPGPALPIGSSLELTGVCSVQVDSSRFPKSFQIYLRSPGDLTVLQTPSWWNARHTLWVLAALAIVLFGSLAWVGSLRNQVRQRTGQLHAEIEEHKRTEVALEEKTGLLRREVEQRQRAQAELEGERVILKKEIEERKRAELEVEKSHKDLVSASRQAGMAEVATGVLHNVGNVLNSVNVSASLIADQLRKSKTVNVRKVASLLAEHTADLGEFLTTHPRGKELPRYLGHLADHLDAEHSGVLAELDLLKKNIEHIKDIVSVQQSYARVSGVSETVKVTDLIEDTLRMNAGALLRHEVQVVREYDSHVTEISVDKHKVLQILVNLVRNAKHACEDSGRAEKRVNVRVTNGDDRVRIAVADNGVGIPAENLTRIFSHGFTTRKDGHGFGLHSGALAARELGGHLHVHSDGPDLGAVFTLELPLRSPNAPHK